MDRVSEKPKQDSRYQYPHIELEEVKNFKNYGHESGLFKEVQ